MRYVLWTLKLALFLLDYIMNMAWYRRLLEFLRSTCRPFQKVNKCKSVNKVLIAYLSDRTVPISATKNI